MPSCGISACRVCFLGVAVGAGLAVAGAVLQAVVRNMLADPFTLGINSGASTGAALAILFGVGAALEYVPDQLILYRDADFRQRTVVNMHPQASLFLSDIITPGWSPRRRYVPIQAGPPAQRGPHGW